MATATKTPFSPYQVACDLGATEHSGGINWSYATFDNETALTTFIARCKQNGYRTRNERITDGGDLSVQYHHYSD